MKFTKTKESENRIILTLEEPDDLFSLRRIIEIGDIIVADTTRVIKQDSEYARPDKGERIKVRISLRVEKISFDNTIDRLKITGIITASNNEHIPKGMYHSIMTKVNDTIVLEKMKWNNNYEKILSKAASQFKYIFISIDSQETAIALLTGTNLKITPNIHSGKSGKRYKAGQKTEPSTKNYFDSIKMALETHLEELEIKVIIFGPGETKRKLVNYLAEYFKNVNFIIIEGIETAGEDGIFVFLRSEIMREFLSNSKIAMVSMILDKLMQQINKNEKKFAIGIKDIKYAHELNAIDSLVYSDKVFSEIEEDDFIRILNDMESKNIKIFATDSSTDIGLRVSSLGGVIALLRYQIF